MSFAAPGFLLAAVAAAVVVAALHLFAWRRPPPSPLPTARFIPEHPVRAVSRAVRPSDLALLVLRTVLLVLVGAALARPSLDRRAERLARVIVIDVSRAVGDGVAARERWRREHRSGDALVVFDSTAREIAAPSADSLVTEGPTARRGSLSAAIAVAVRAAVRLQRSHDSVEIVVVSPVVAEELDAATHAIRRTWRGPVRIARIAPASRLRLDSAAPATVRAEQNDPVAAALVLAGAVPGGAAVRVVRDGPAAADSAWAVRGGALVVWPGAAPPPAWTTRPRADTVFGVAFVDPEGRDGAADAATVVAPFSRTSRPPPGRVIARWSDGEPAVTESALGGGCVRHVAVAIAGAGDLALGSSFRRFVRRAIEPCGSPRDLSPASDSVVLALATGGRPDSLAPARGAVASAGPADTSAGTSRLVIALLALALAAAVSEPFVRRRVEAAGART